MATVTGTLNDVGLGHLADKEPEMQFTLSEIATSPQGLFATDPVTVIPDEDGAFTVSLEPTETMHQRRYYRLAVRWLDSAGNFVKVDFPDWRVQVPAVGGDLSDLIPNYASDGAGWNPLMVFFSPTEPDPWPVGSYWVDSSIDTATSGDVRYRKA